MFNGFNDTHCSDEIVDAAAILAESYPGLVR